MYDACCVPWRHGRVAADVHDRHVAESAFRNRVRSDAVARRIHDASCRRPELHEVAYRHGRAVEGDIHKFPVRALRKLAYAGHHFRADIVRRSQQDEDVFHTSEVYQNFFGFAIRFLIFALFGR